MGVAVPPPAATPDGIAPWTLRRTQPAAQWTSESLRVDAFTERGHRQEARPPPKSGLLH